MKLQDIGKMNKDGVLALLGLETKHSELNRWLGTLGTLGIGVVAGAGLALLLAPKAGRDLRQDLLTKVRAQGKAVATNGGQTVPPDQTPSERADERKADHASLRSSSS